MDKLLRAAPGLKIVATSRQSLGVRGEHIQAVLPLSTPDPEHSDSSTGWTMRYEAVRLLVDRARAVGFEITEKDWATAVRLCQTLDGVPLAIELAAVRLCTTFATLEELLERLDADRFRLLTGGVGLIPSHQQTLRRVVDWSYELCSPREQELWARLSVFTGDFDLTAAEAVCHGQDISRGDILDLLASLARQSILSTNKVAGHTRYRLLETIRQYGQQHLAERGEDTELRTRHRDYYRELATQASNNWFGPEELVWLDRLRHELPNMRSAMEWSLNASGQAEAGLDIAICLSRIRFWFFFGTLSEGRLWLSRAIAASSTDEHVLRALGSSSIAWLALCQGDHMSASSVLDVCRSEAKYCQDNSLVQGALAFAEGSYSWLVLKDIRSIDQFGEAKACFREAGLENSDVATAALFLALSAAFLSNDKDFIAKVGNEILAESRQRQAPWVVSWSLWVLGLMELRFLDSYQATILFREALQSQHAMRDQWGTVWSVEALSWSASATGHYEQAVRLIGATEKMRQTTGVSLKGIRPFADAHAEAEQRARQALSTRAYLDAHERGMSLTYDETVMLALTGNLNLKSITSAASAATEKDSTDLTTREHEVARLVAEGLTNKGIATKLVISARTVETHVQHILEKLGFDTRAQIAAWVAHRGGQ